MQGRTLFAQGTFIPAHLRGVGYVPQEGALFPHLTSRTISPGALTAPAEKYQQVAALMERVSLDRQLANHWPARNFRRSAAARGPGARAGAAARADAAG